MVPYLAAVKYKHFHFPLSTTNIQYRLGITHVALQGGSSGARPELLTTVVDKTNLWVDADDKKCGGKCRVATPTAETGPLMLCTACCVSLAVQVNAHYDTLLTEDVGRWDHLLSHQLLLVMKCLASKAGEPRDG